MTPGYPIDANQLTLATQLYIPDPLVSGDGPYPAVIILHGSGGLWSNDVIDSGPISHLDQWGVLLADMGYLVLLPDSYKARGIPEGFEGRRPHYNPAFDDHLCSPNYERPKDVVASLEYLTTRNDFDGDNVALIGFSHGAQTAMNAVVDVSVDLGQYTVSYIDLIEGEEDSIPKDVDSPVRIPDDLPFPKLGLFYYGGGSHYGYHGQASSIAAGRYMIDRRMKALIFHGTDDYLLNVDDPETLPMTGVLYPIKQALSSSAQAAAIGVDDPLQRHYLLDLAEHSFDLAAVTTAEDDETANEMAKRLCREESIKWLEFCLKPSPAAAVAHDVTPGNVDLSVTSTNTRLNYQWLYSDNLVDWFDEGSAFDGDGADIELGATLGPDDRRFFVLEYAPIAPPLASYPDFFRDYNDFNY